MPKPTIIWEDGIRKGWNEFEKKGRNVWCDYEGLRKFIKTWGFIEFDKNGNLYVERSITMPIPNGDIDSEDSTLYQNQIEKYKKNVGGCWAVGRGTSAAYCGNSNETTIILKGYMFLDDIYWEDCVRLWMRPNTEFEVRTYPNGRVMMTEIQVDDKTLSMKSFDGPRILKSTFFGNRETFHGNFVKLGYENSGYDKTFIDRQGNEYKREEYINTIFPRLLKNGGDLSEITEFCGEEKEGFIRFCVGGK